VLGLEVKPSLVEELTQVVLPFRELVLKWEVLPLLVEELE